MAWSPSGFRDRVYLTAVARGGGGGGSSYAPIGATGVAAMGTPPSVTISYTVPATATTDGSKPAPSRVVREVTHVPAKTLDKVGTGRVSLRVQKLSGKRLESGGKPEGLALTLAWCPHCAANSWSYAIALSRFGKLSGLRVINAGTYYEHHGGKPGYPDAHGLSFFHTTYHSKYLKFVDVIEQNVEGENLETPTAREQAAFNSFDPHGSAPALDVGGIYGFVGAGYTPGLLGKQGWAKIAGVLAHAKGKLGRSIDGFANVLTAMFCKATKDRPASVCASKGVKAAAKLLPS